MRRGGWAACLSGFTVALAVFAVGAAAQATTGRIELVGEGSGVVRYVAEGPGIPGGRYEDECPEACVMSWPLAGLTITLTAIALEESRFIRWGGRCAPAGANPSCTFTGTTGLNVVEARFDPPKLERLQVPLRGTTKLDLADAFVAKLRRQGWKLQAIAPARLDGRTLTLPIAASGPLTISRRTSSMQIEKTRGKCYVSVSPSYTVHHAGGIRLSRPGGKRNRIPLDVPVISSRTGSPVFMFRDSRDRTVARSGNLSKAKPGLVLSLAEGEMPFGELNAAALRVRGGKTRLNRDSWIGLVENSANPGITSGLFGTVELTLRIPPNACS